MTSGRSRHGSTSCVAAVELDKLLYDEIAAHRRAVAEGTAGDDVLSMLIEAETEDGSGPHGRGDSR